MFETITPTNTATDEKMSVFWCCPSATIAGLLICFPIEMMYSLILKFTIIPKVAIIAAYVSGMVINSGWTILSIAPVIISYAIIAKNTTISNPLIASARPWP